MPQETRYRSSAPSRALVDSELSRESDNTDDETLLLNDSKNMEEALEVAWTRTWCRAFPTLLPEYVTNADLSLQLLAFDEVFPSLSSSRHAAMPAQVEPTSVLENSLGYGEMTARTVFQVMDWIPCHDNGWQPNVCVDLGSGNGRVLFATALAYSFRILRGMEIRRDLHDDALNNLRLWRERSVGHSRFHLLCTDFTLDPNLVTDAQLVWVHATVFEQDLMESVQHICESCSSGTYFVMVSKSLNEQNGIVARASLPLDMNWGQTTVYIQTKE